MMSPVSILIPVFNWDCTRLVQDLQEQASRLGCAYEILVADDSSTDQELKQKNASISDLVNCLYIQLDSNIGRSAIRNLLADKAQYKYLLFMDCDAQVASDSFLRSYLMAAENAPVVCGGLKHQEKLPRPGVELRYRYERRSDILERPASVRQQQPYARFTPFSFLIKRDLFLEIRFNEGIRRYGYEDVLFGKELQRRQVPVLHIDNQLIHLGLEENGVFLKKTEEALRSLEEYSQHITDASKLLSTYNTLRKYHLTGLMHIIWTITEKPLRKNLTGNHPSLRLFSLYKLLYFSELNK